MFLRIVLSIITIGVAGFAHALFSPTSAIGLGWIAGMQMQPSDAAAIEFGGLSHIFYVADWLLLAVPLLILAAIWYAPMKRWIAAASALALALVLFAPQSARAFYATTDKTEVFSIQPNHSAFWIPNQGDNKSSQTKLDSEDYFNANKIAAKFFVIPHFKLSGSAGYSMFAGYDFYVPSGRLIIVDRSPQNREWVTEAKRGTGNSDEGLHCQSKEGLSITVGVSLSADVSEDDAARFLYNFGVAIDPKDDVTDPNVVFRSTYYGRSLASVMDNNVRHFVQGAICNQIGSRTFELANNDMISIMVVVQKETETYMKSVGVTLRFIGYADTWGFDPTVQQAIDQRYEAQTLAQFTQTLQEVRQLDVQAGLAKGLENHGLPIVVNQGMFDSLINLGKSLFQNAAPAQ
jgi:hypothetical protein